MEKLNKYTPDTYQDFFDKNLSETDPTAAGGSCP